MRIRSVSMVSRVAKDGLTLPSLFSSLIYRTLDDGVVFHFANCQRLSEGEGCIHGTLSCLPEGLE